MYCVRIGRAAGRSATKGRSLARAYTPSSLAAGKMTDLNNIYVDEDEGLDVKVPVRLTNIAVMPGYNSNVVCCPYSLSMADTEVMRKP
jgi:hypothetical protein